MGRKLQPLESLGAHHLAAIYSDVSHAGPRCILPVIPEPGPSLHVHLTRRKRPGR